MDYVPVVQASAKDLHVTKCPMNGVQVPDTSRHHLVYGPTPYVVSSQNYANEACLCVPVPPMQGPLGEVQHYMTTQLPPPAIQQVFFEPGRPEFHPHPQHAPLPTLNISGHLNPPPSFYFPPIQYPPHSEGLESAKEKPELLSQFGSYNGGLPNLDQTFPEIELAPEYRQDLILGAAFHPIWSLNPALDFGQHIFMPNQPYVYTVVESVIHYYDQPYTSWVNGKWISGKARLPFAHHICVCLDDGIKRYEEVFRVGIMSANSPEGIYVPEESIVSVSVRLLKPAQHVRPTFGIAIGESLRQMIPKHASKPIEFSVTREELAGNNVSGAIGEFVSGAQDPFETHFYPILQNVFQSFTVRLTQAHYLVTSHFYRPLLTGATSLLSSGDSQVLDVVKLDFCWEDHRIRGTASETALGRRVYDQQGLVSMVITHSGSKLSNEGGPRLWTQLPPQCHPFINLTLNPVHNRNFDPYWTYSFNIPPVFCSRMSAYPPSFRSVGCAVESSPLPYFYPMPVPAPVPPQLFPYILTHGDPEMELYESEPEVSSQMHLTAPGSSPTSMGFNDMAIEHSRATDINSNEICHEDEASEGSSLEISLDLDSKAPISTTLNPNAQDFIPRSMMDNGFECSESVDTTLSRSDGEESNNEIIVSILEPLSHSSPEEDSGTPSASEDESDLTEASTSPDLETCLEPLPVDQTNESAHGMDPNLREEPPSVNSFQNSWSDEVEEIPISEEEPARHASYAYERNSWDSRPPTGRGGYRGTRGRGKRDSSWTQRSFPAQKDSLNWRRDSLDNGGHDTRFEEAWSNGPSRYNYYQRRNSSQLADTSRSYNKHYGPNPSKATDPSAYYQSGRGRRGRGHNSGFEFHYQQYEYPQKSAHFESQRSRPRYYTQGNDKGRESGSKSSSLLHNQNSSAEEVRELDQGAPTIGPREMSRDPPTKRRSEPNSAEESHGKAVTGLLITETTYTNSQNEAYRNFNKNYGSRGYVRNYKSYEGGTRNNGDRAGRSSGPSTAQTERTRPDLGDQEHGQAESGHYGVKKPVAQNLINKKFRKFKMSNVGAEEDSMMEAFLDPQEGRTRSRRNPTSHILCPRNLIEVPRSSCPEDFPPVEPPHSSPVQGPAVSTLEGQEIVESAGSGPPTPDQTKRKLRKPRWRKTRMDGEVVKSSSSDEGPRAGSAGSTPRQKNGPVLQGRTELIAGDGDVSSGTVSRSGHGHGGSGGYGEPSN